MLRGYQCFFVALGLTLASPSYSQDGKTNQRTSENDSAAQLARIASAVEKQPVATAPDRGCEPGQDNRQSDLCAQWKAADAAAESAKWSLWTLVLTGIGLAIGWGTLFAAWRAAHWAKKAADHTEVAAKAAEANFAPKLHFRIDGIKINTPDSPIELSVIFENAGYSPLFDVHAECGLQIICEGAVIFEKSKSSVIPILHDSPHGKSSFSVQMLNKIDDAPIVTEKFRDDCGISGKMNIKIEYRTVLEKIVTTKATAHNKTIRFRNRDMQLWNNGFSHDHEFEITEIKSVVRLNPKKHENE